MEGGALAKGLRLLRLFDEVNREKSLQELFQGAHLSRMTAYRMVRTLEAASFLVRDPKTNRYHLGPAVIAMRYVWGPHEELVATARPYLRELARRTGETTVLVMEVDGYLVRADMVKTPRPSRLDLALGQIVDSNTDAGGKVFVEERVTYEREERARGICAVAAPVRDVLGNVIAALSVVVPSGRFGAEEEFNCALEVRNAAGALSAELGYSENGGWFGRDTDSEFAVDAVGAR